MDDRKLIDEIKKLVSQKDMIPGFFNGTTFTSDTRTKYTNLVLTSYNPGRAFIVKYQDKWLCVVSASNELIRTNIIVDRRNRYLENNITYLVKTLFDIYNSKNYNLDKYIGGDHPDAIQILSTNDTVIDYITNLGIDKYLVSMKLIESGLRKYLFKSEDLEEPIELTNPITDGNEYYLGNGLWESNSGSPTRNMIHDLKLYSFPVSIVTTNLYDSYNQPLTLNKINAYADTWTPENDNSRTIFTLDIVNVEHGESSPLQPTNPTGLVYYLNRATISSQEITLTFIKLTVIASVGDGANITSYLAEITAHVDGKLEVKESFGGRALEQNTEVQRGFYGTSFVGFDMVIRNAYWLNDGRTRPYMRTDFLIDRLSPNNDYNRLLQFIPYVEPGQSISPPSIIKENYIANYAGKFVALKTIDEYIEQDWAAKIEIKRDNEDPSKNKSILTETKNILTLKIKPDKNIVLNNIDFFVVSSGSMLLPINENSTSFTLVATSTYNKDFNVNSAIGQPILFGKIIDKFPALIKGTIISAIYSMGGTLTIQIAISKISLNTYSSFLNNLITDNGSYYSYHFRKNLPATFGTFANKSLLKLIPLNPIVSTFLSLSYIKEINEITGINLRTDNIVDQDIYSVVNISGDIASIEQWNILDDGRIIYDKVFETPYCPIPEDSNILGHSFNPK